MNTIKPLTVKKHDLNISEIYPIGYAKLSFISKEVIRLQIGSVVEYSLYEVL
jgi:hypothetical protein|tara:strand:+ start:917 stop:1072 length:156 start_codon:yes stop_codon:yes gene_type:complete